jgi:hypothetical protein
MISCNCYLRLHDHFQVALRLLYNLVTFSNLVSSPHLLNMSQIYIWMNEWMDGWMDGRTDGWMDGWLVM